MAKKLKTTVKFKTELKDGSSVLTYTVKDGVVEVNGIDAHYLYQHPLFHLIPGEPIIEKPVAKVDTPAQPGEADEPDEETPEEKPEEEEEEEKPKKKKKKATKKKKKKKTEDE